MMQKREESKRCYELLWAKAVPLRSTFLYGGFGLEESPEMTTQRE